MSVQSFYEQMVFPPGEYLGLFQKFCVFLLFVGLLWDYLSAVVQSLSQDLEHALVWRSLTAGTVTRG